MKTRLVPFGEYIPLRRVLGWVARVSDAAEVDRGRGDGPVVMRTGEVTFGPLICFESTFPDMARRQVGLGSELLVYQTASTTFQGTWAQPQHAVAAVRAVETGRPVVHVALTGTTAAYDETGRLLLWVAPGEQTSAVVDLTLTGGRTPYALAGDWVLVLAALVIVAGLVAAALSSRSTPPDPRSPLANGTTTPSTASAATASIPAARSPSATRAGPTPSASAEPTPEPTSPSSSRHSSTR